MYIYLGIISIFMVHMANASESIVVSAKDPVYDLTCWQSGNKVLDVSEHGIISYGTDVAKNFIVDIQRNNGKTSEKLAVSGEVLCFISTTK